MEWRDQGIVIGIRGHGETSAIVDVLTQERGRCSGLVRGGKSRRMRPLLQPGNLLSLRWHARLEEHLGTFTVEPLHLRAGFILDDALRLAGLSSLTAMAMLLPEREPHPRLFEACKLVLEAVDQDGVWPALLVRWELGLLDELGFGLDLTRCAATGVLDELHYVSPRTGRAVSREPGLPYASKLFALPPFLRGESGFEMRDIIAGFALTGHFLQRHVFGPRAIEMPQQREWLWRALALQAEGATGDRAA
jgi:DNA repair protein RecO (recombination protein O)